MISRIGKYAIKSNVKNTCASQIKTISIQLRNFSKYRLLGIEGFECPSSEIDAVEKVKNQLEIAKKVNFLAPNKNSLNIIASHEFSFNGKKDLFGYINYNASNPIPLNYYEKAIKEIQEYLKKLPEGILFLPGTAAIDTGEKLLDGRTIYENRGCGITSGSQSKIFEFSKQSISKLDKWDKKLFVKKGDDPLIIEIKDHSGDGKSIWLASTICLDFIYHVDNFKKTPDILFVPACGWPRKIPSIDSDIIVVDGIQNPFRVDSDFHYSGVHRIRNHKFEPSLSSQLFFYIASGNAPIPKFITEIAKTMQNWNFFKKNDETERLLILEKYKSQTIDQKGVIITEEIPLKSLYKEDKKIDKGIY
jgi:hypothetical protein